MGRIFCGRRFGIRLGDRKGGFTEGLKDLEQNGEVHLFTLEDLYK